MTQPAGEELLVQAANRARAEQRSGKALRVQVPFIAVFSAAGWWLVFGIRLSPVLKDVVVAAGIAAFVIAALFVFGAVAASPIASWGKAVRGPCPRCGQPKLREDKALHFTAPGSGKLSAKGVVTLCTADCGYAAVRDIKVSADGGLAQLKSV
jgi:hypothetical protein